MATYDEKIMKLGKKITDRIPQKLGLVKLTKDDPEYWGLKAVVTEEMADIALTMKVRHPYTFEEIQQLNPDIEKSKLERILQEMSIYGVLEYNWENERRQKQYILPQFVPGSAEFFMMHPTLAEEKPEIADFFERMTFLPLEKVTAMVPPGGAGIGMHVIPVEKAIPAHQESVSVEHISHWLNKYDQYGIGICSCRRQQTIRNEGTGDIEGEYCIGVGDMAQYLVETGKGRLATYDEVIETLKRAERNGYVHQITNIDGENKIFAICNCAPGVCNALRTSQLFNTPNMSASAYRAHVEIDKCVACGKCVEVCPVGAAKLGQKLCTKNGPVQYPKVELPDDNKWGQDKWDLNYKDSAKINCYDSGTAPCKSACPAHLAIQGYIKMAGEGRYQEALELIKQDNPFPAVCGDVCNRRCEDVCTRGTIDEPIAIDEIKKFIARIELDKEQRFIPLCENGEGKFYEQKIAVIGAGPSGMSAAYYLRKRGYPVTIFEKECRAGGMLINGIPSFRLEKNILEAEIDILKEMGIEFVFNKEVGKDITIQQLRDEGYKAFYIAIGAQGGRNIAVAGNDAQGVIAGVDYLRHMNIHGTHPHFHGQCVVIGGGNVAIDVARTALRDQSESVTMFTLEKDYHEMPAALDEIDEAIEEGIVIENGWGPKEILVEDGKVKGVVFKKCLSVFNEQGCFAPRYDENDTKMIECQTVLLSVGQSIIWNDLLKDTAVQINPNGTAKADSTTLQTDEPDIFAGGDVHTGPLFAIDAIADGKEACESIHRFVHPGNSLTLGRDLRQFIQLNKDDVMLPIESFDNAKRQVPGKKEGIAKETFKDLRLPLTKEQVEKEAKRCLGCGATIVDTNKCIGCGLCTTRCEFDAIHLSRDIPEASRMYKSEDKLKAIGPYAAKRAIKITRKKKS